ncbi:MAG: hypothetical protein K940chlam2_01771 [Chlamydiae bacterium]|nr:hypothetical protein [Chlamydiota bacterium]
MAATTQTVPYDSIYVKFPNGTSWGFVRRSNGEWSWSEMRNIQHIPDQVPAWEVFDTTPKPVFKVSDSVESSRPVDPDKKKKVDYELFQKIFPEHPDTLKPFQLTGAKVDAQYAQVLGADNSSSEAEGGLAGPHLRNG